MCALLSILFLTQMHIVVHNAHPPTAWTASSARTTFIDSASSFFSPPPWTAVSPWRLLSGFDSATLFLSSPVAFHILHSFMWISYSVSVCYDNECSIQCAAASCWWFISTVITSTSSSSIVIIIIVWQQRRWFMDDEPRFTETRPHWNCSAGAWLLE